MWKRTLINELKEKDNSEGIKKIETNNQVRQSQETSQEKSMGLCQASI